MSFPKDTFSCCLFVHTGLHNNDSGQVPMTNTILQK